MAPETDPRPRIPTDSLPMRLIALRHEEGWSQREAAIATGVPLGVWQGMELGRGTRGVTRHIAAIAASTGYDRDWLMWGGPFTVELTRRLRVVRSDSRLSLVRQTAA